MSVSTLLNYPPGSWEQFWGRSWSASEFLNTQGITTAHRDGIIATDGMIIYNSDNNAIEGYINGSWQSLATASQIPPTPPNSSFSCQTNGLVNLTGGGTSTFLNFNFIFYDNNNDLSNSSGHTIYTAPVNGIYSFGFSCQVSLLTGTLPYLDIALTDNSSFYPTIAFLGNDANTNSTSVYNISGSIFAQLNAGSAVTIRADLQPLIPASSCTLYHAQFSGCLVRQI
jgi:hypothetical protein